MKKNSGKKGLIIALICLILVAAVAAALIMNRDKLGATEETTAAPTETTTEHTHEFPRACDLDPDKWPDDTREVCAIYCEECGKLVLNPNAEHDEENPGNEACAHDFEERTKELDWSDTCPTCKSTLKRYFVINMGTYCIYDELKSPEEEYTGYGYTSCPVCGANLIINAENGKITVREGTNRYTKATLVSAASVDGYTRITYKGQQYYITDAPSGHPDAVCDEDGINPTSYWDLYTYQGGSLTKASGVPAYIGDGTFYTCSGKVEITYNSSGSQTKKVDHSSCEDDADKDKDKDKSVEKVEKED